MPPATHISFTIDKQLKPAPNISELLKFSQTFSKEDWLKCCENKEFLNLIDSENIKEAEELSKKILTKKN